MNGVIAGIIFVISCGDNLHLAADAVIDGLEPADAAPGCDCPVTEPPLAFRFVVFSQLQVVPGNDRGGQGVSCPAGTRLISGSCTTNLGSPLRDVTLRESGDYYDPPSAWGCEFRNNEANPVTIRVSALCLKPMP